MDIDLKTLTPRRHAQAVVTIICNHSRWRRGAEIGVAQGRTTLAILAGCSHVSLIAVDPFRYIEDAERSGLYRDFDFAHCEACVRAVATAHPGRLEIMKMSSAEAAPQIKDGSLDFIFVDANHTYAEVARDLDLWGPKVTREGGWIIGHDYSRAWPGVMRAVDERFGRPMQFDNAVWAVENRWTGVHA